MALTIKNDRVCDLAREAAQRSGQSQVSVIEQALERYLADYAEPVGRRVDEVLARIDASLAPGDAAAMRVELDRLYDERGLPA